jgi:hypothetical protein
MQKDEREKGIEDTMRKKCKKQEREEGTVRV